MTTDLNVLRQQPLTLIGPATQTLADGGSISVWRKAMELAIRRSQTASFIAGLAERLGVKPNTIKGLSRAERKDLDKRIAFQVKYLDKFASDLRAGKLSPQQAAARANLYSGATRGTFYATRYPELKTVPGAGDTPCNGNCRCYLEQDGKKVYWRLTAAESCAGCVELANGSPYSVGGDE